jgi:hypothetical protein
MLLIQELENDFSYLCDSAELLGRATFRVEASLWADELDLMALGGCLHGVYNALEAYFLRVAKFFENNVDQQAWHRDLLDRMILEIPDIRPALLTDPDVVENIDELRRFRHLFRNLYKTRLKAPKLRIVYEAAKHIADDFLPMHRAFLSWLKSLAEAV